MKKIALISAIAISGLLFNDKANAQIRIHVGFNLAPRPVVYAQPAPVVVEQSGDIVNLLIMMVTRIITIYQK